MAPSIGVEVAELVLIDKVRFSKTSLTSRGPLASPTHRLLVDSVGFPQSPAASLSMEALAGLGKPDLPRWLIGEPSPPPGQGDL